MELKELKELVEIEWEDIFDLEIECPVCQYSFWDKIPKNWEVEIQCPQCSEFLTASIHRVKTRELDYKTADREMWQLFKQ